MAHALSQGAASGAWSRARSLTRSALPSPPAPPSPPSPPPLAPTVQAAIKNEAGNGLLNARGTLAMARTNVVDSATAQFFINLKDNDFLNHKSEDDAGFGYAVFGKVLSGMDVVDGVAKVPTGTQNGMGDVPNEPVTIVSVKVADCPTAPASL